MEALHKVLCPKDAQNITTLTWKELQAALAEQDKNCACSVQPEVELVNAELWKEFHSNTNEMIITKAGRRMFPLLELSFQNLDRKATYILLLALRTKDNRRWRFLNGEWQGSVPGVGSVTGEGGEGKGSVYVHPSSPSTGEEWMRLGPVGFTKLKLSNKGNNGGKVKLSSLHHYQPLVCLVKLPPDESSLQEHKQRHDHGKTTAHPVLEITTNEFPETQFIAVTAYQNDMITQMKIKHNPFAKAFLPNQLQDTTSASPIKQPLPIATSTSMYTHHTAPSQDYPLTCNPSVYPWPMADEQGIRVQPLNLASGNYSDTYAPPPCLDYNYEPCINCVPYPS
uniref:Brachyury protein n=1 Tax=Suberites domuncula TaxID=55567 RepID=Q70TF6_SUBDO|nr:brachyury protein [Suberites domuncula]